MPSQQTLFHVAHAISGRIRYKIPRLRTDLDFRYRLKTFIESVEGVTQIRLNAEAQSIVVHYDPKTLAPASVQACLDPLIERAAQQGSPGQPEQGAGQPSDRLVVRFDRDLAWFAAATLTPYEQEQVREISLWLSDVPGELEQDIGKVFDAVAAEVRKFLIPDGVAQQLQQAAETVTANWPSDWERLKPATGVEDYRQLRQAELTFCDNLAQGVRKEACATGAVKGGLSDLAGWLGAGLSLPLSVLLALQTVHRIGLCYGYSPETKHDKQMAWVVMGLGTATTPEDKRAAVGAWRDCHLLLYPQILKDLVQTTIQTDDFDRMVESLMRRVVGRFMKKESGGVLPVVGAVLGAWGEVSAVEDVSLAAHRVFQLRWLADNEKLEPGSALARPGNG